MMAAPALSSSYVRPAPTIACALHNVLRAATKGPQSGTSLTDVGITTARSTVTNSPSTSEVGNWAPFSESSRRAVTWEQQSRGGWWRRSNRCGMHVQAAASAIETTEEASKLQTGTWTWSYEGSPVSINYDEYASSTEETGSSQGTLLLVPTISDVSTTEEWRAVAEGLVAQGSWRAVVVDWPGLGLSERPPLEYTVDVLENFLVDFVTATSGPLATTSGESLVIIGGGHAAIIAVRALSKGLIKARALAAVAPTWSGPLPIVFGRSPTMETRYGLLRGTLRSAGVGWAMYKYLVSSPKNIRMQYLTHVYADADNVTPAVVENRTALTQRDGARFAPAAFLTGLLDPAKTREEFVSLFANLEGKTPVLVLATEKSPRRSRAEMEALEGVKGVTKFEKLKGALLPQEEYPEEVLSSIKSFLDEL